MFDHDSVILFAELDYFLLVLLQLASNEIALSLGALWIVRSLYCWLSRLIRARPLSLEYCVTFRST